MAHERQIRSIVIVGGGSAGWMAAAALANVLKRDCRITLVESEEIGTIGVGEATIPPIKLFNQMLGIAESEFIRRTQGSFKLGIQFVDWAKLGHRYFHPFGTYARAFDTVQVHHYWARAHAAGSAGPLDDYCMAWGLASENRFAPPQADQRSILSTYDYAYHFDAGLYAAYLREYAQARGVTRLEGRVVSVSCDNVSGFVTDVRLDDGRRIDGDFFIDCSGFRALLISGAMGNQFVDWTHWLPCDRAVAVPTASSHDFTPYTRSTAREAGWQWRIPLQHRTGNGYVYCSQLIDADEASQALLSNLDGKVLGEPRTLRFAAGHRQRFWDKNVVAIGLSGGFVEPLESTALHLIQAGISKLLALFPDRDFDPLLQDEFNRISIGEMERIRDFLILHYKLTERTDSELWRRCSAMEIPDSLATRMEHFRRYGQLVVRDLDLFAPASWLAVHVGQLNGPVAVDRLIDYGVADGEDWLRRIRAAIVGEASKLPSHQAYIDRYCKAAEHRF